MRIRTSVLGSEVDAYILTSYDEHLNEELVDSDKRIEYLTGFSGTGATLVVIFLIIFKFNFFLTNKN